MNNYYFCFTLLTLFLNISVFGQNIKIEGYVFAENNTGFLNNVTLGFFTPDSTKISETKSNLEGKFEELLPAGKNYRIIASKKGFKTTELSASTINKKEDETVYVKLAMVRAPGYIFEATLSELAPEDHEGPIDALTDCTIEIYNNTKKEEVLILKNHPKHTFSFTFEKGNSYTLMIRKKGFFTKRLQANVDINDCILCFEGIGTIRPGVSDNLSAVGGHSAGVLGTDIKLKRIEVGEVIAVNNIYYDLAKWELRDESLLELDKLSGILRDNPHLLIELGSHTDSRGKEENNYTLSAKRAQSAVDYLIIKGVEKYRLSARGYGESDLKNGCTSYVECPEEKHQENRRTEFKVTGYTAKNPYEDKSLRQILFDEQIEAMVEGYDEGTIIMVPEDGRVPVNPERDKEGNLLPGQEEYVAVPEEVIEGTGATNDLLGGATETVKIGSQEMQDAIENSIPEHKPAIEKSKPTLGKENTSIESPSSESMEEMKVPGVHTQIEKDVAAATPIIETPVNPTSITPEVTEAPEVITTTTQPVVETVTQVDPMQSVENAIQQQIKEIEAEVNSEEIIEDGSIEEEEEVEPTPQVVKLNKNYTGFKIEITSSSEELPLTHSIFKEFGKINIELNVKEKFHYLMGDFRNGNLAMIYLQRSVLPRYPNAKVVHYQGGERFGPSE